MKQYIKDMKPGDKISSKFKLKSIEKGTTKNGDLFARGVLRDMTGDVEFIWFGISQSDLDLIDDADIVSVIGTGDQRNNVLQFKVTSLLPTTISENEESDFVPLSFLPYDILEVKLDKYINSIQQPFLKMLAESIFVDDLDIRSKFMDYPASIRNHHNFKHGLLQHTLEMIDIVMADADMVPSWCSIHPKKDILIVGTLVHDIGKILEYTKHGSDYTYDTEGALLGHISLGMELVSKKIDLIPNFPSLLSSTIKHIILSHHGKKEWGSPIVPLLAEAELIHLADHKSAAFQLWGKAYEVSPVRGESYTKAEKLKGSDVMERDRSIFARHEDIKSFWGESN